MSRANAAYRKHQRRVDALARFKATEGRKDADYHQRKADELAALNRRVAAFNARSFS